MLVKTRTTINGIEYWDRINKRSVLIPHGTTPAKVQTEGMVGQYSASGKTADAKENEIILDVPTEVPIDEMNATQLRQHAKDNGIEVPGNIKKTESIRKYIIEELNAAADAE